MATREDTDSGLSLGAPAADVRRAGVTGDLNDVAESLHDRYDSRVGVAVVNFEVQRIADRFVDAPIRAFVPLFVRRYAGESLREGAARLSSSAV